MYDQKVLAIKKNVHCHNNWFLVLCLSYLCFWFLVFKTILSNTILRDCLLHFDFSVYKKYNTRTMYKNVSYEFICHGALPTFQEIHFTSKHF